MTTAQSLRNNPNIEIDRAAEELCVHYYYSTPTSIKTYFFQDGSMLVLNAWGVLFNN